MTRAARFCAAIGGLGLLASPDGAKAHHSFAMFDSQKTLTLDGVVTWFEWGNPHVFIMVYVPSSTGAQDQWSVELTSPGNLTRQGWARAALKPGDKVLLEINPLRDGQHGGAFKQITFAATGKVLRSGQLAVTRP